MDYSQLSDFEINGLVSKLTQRFGDFTQVRNKTFIHEYSDVGHMKGICIGWKEFDPCNNPTDAWPIIESNYIALHPLKHKSVWIAMSDDQEHTVRDEKPLRAAMIIFLMSKESFNA